MDQPIRGSCLCGGIRFEITGPPLWLSWCHCTRCRKVGGMANVSLTKFIAISLVFRTMRFGGESLLFYFLGERARRLIEKYFNTATVVVIILLAVLAYAMKKLGHLFTG